MKHHISLLLALGALACSGSGTTPASETGPDVPVDVPFVDPGTDVGPDPGTGCQGDAPLCASVCGSDAFVSAAVCEGTKWVCKQGVLPQSCPAGTCWGPPTPGEVCGKNGWECRPDQTGGYAQCPDLMCPECTGFAGPTEVSGCACECNGSQVVCHKTTPDGSVPDTPDTAEPVPDVPDVPEVVDTPEAITEVVVDAGALSPAWTVDKVDDRPAFKSRVAMAVAQSGALHVVYNVATSADGWDTPEVWHAVGDGKDWTRTLVAAANGVSNEFPVLVLDSKDAPHVFFNRYDQAEDQIDVFAVTGDGAGGFPAPQNVTKSSHRDEYGPSAFVEPDDTTHLLFQVRTPMDAPGEYAYSVEYLRLASEGTLPAETVAEGSAQPGLNPEFDLAVDAGHTVHAVYCRPGKLGLNNVLFYRTRTAQGWGVEKALTPADLDVWDPGLAVDGTGTVHVAYTFGPDWDTKTLYYQRISGGLPGPAQALSTSTRDRSYYLGLVVDNAGKVFLGFERFVGDDKDLFFLTGQDGVFPPEERVTATAEGDESTPALALGLDGSVYLAFTENLAKAPNGVVGLAVRGK